MQLVKLSLQQLCILTDSFEAVIDAFFLIVAK